MGQSMIQGTVLHAGAVEGPVLVLTEPLSFWGAFDPRTGCIVDTHHRQRGTCLTGKVLMMRESRGSGTAPGAIAEAIRLGTAPLALILVTPDINLAIGAAVAARLYGTRCPVISVNSDDYAILTQNSRLAISNEGLCTFA
jgi:uncharacterized protein